MSTRHSAISTWSPRRVAAWIAALVLCLAFAGEARAADSFRVAEEAMHAWQMGEARRAIDELAGQRPGAPELLYLEARFDFYEGRYAEAKEKIAKAIDAVPARTDWKQLEAIIASTHDVTKNYERHVSPSGRFEIYIEPGRDRVLLPLAFEALDKAYDALGEELGYRPPTPIRVEIYPQTRVLARVSILTDDEIRTSGTIALCQYNRVMITSPRALMRGYGWVDTLVHEYVHYVVNQKANNRVPIWMHEGLAKFLERRWRGPDEHMLPVFSEKLLRDRLAADTLIPFEAMHPSMAKLPSQEDAALAFAEVYTVMEYLRAHAGPGAFARLLDTINEGHDAQTAYARVLDTTFPRFERDWKSYLERRKTIEIPDDTYEERLVFRDEQPGSDDTGEGGELNQVRQPLARDHINLGQLLQARGRYTAAVVQYEKAVRLVGDTNPVLQTRLARSLLEIERPAEARDALVTVQKLYPGYLATWIELGRAHLALGDAARARDSLLEAARINPFNPEVHTELARAYDKLGQPEQARQAREHARLVQ